MESQVIVMKQRKTTKNKVVYEAVENGHEPAIPSVYIEKELFGKTFPETVKITLEWEE